MRQENQSSGEQTGSLLNRVHWSAGPWGRPKPLWVPVTVIAMLVLPWILSQVGGGNFIGSPQDIFYLRGERALSGFDLRHRVEIADLLVSLADRARTVVAIFHEIDVVRTLFPRVAVMKGGRIVADGPPDRVLTPEGIADAWGISPDRAARL